MSDQLKFIFELVDAGQSERSGTSGVTPVSSPKAEPPQDVGSSSLGSEKAALDRLYRAHEEAVKKFQESLKQLSQRIKEWGDKLTKTPRPGVQPVSRPTVSASQDRAKAAAVSEYLNTLKAKERDKEFLYAVGKGGLSPEERLAYRSQISKGLESKRLLQAAAKYKKLRARRQAERYEDEEGLSASDLFRMARPLSADANVWARLARMTPRARGKEITRALQIGGLSPRERTAYAEARQYSPLRESRLDKLAKLLGERRTAAKAERMAADKAFEQQRLGAIRVAESFMSRWEAEEAADKAGASQVAKDYLNRWGQEERAKDADRRKRLKEAIKPSALAYKEYIFGGGKVSKHPYLQKWSDFSDADVQREADAKMQRILIGSKYRSEWTSEQKEWWDKYMKGEMGQWLPQGPVGFMLYRGMNAFTPSMGRPLVYAAWREGSHRLKEGETSPFPYGAVPDMTRGEWWKRTANITKRRLLPGAIGPMAFGAALGWSSRESYFAKPAGALGGILGGAVGTLIGGPLGGYIGAGVGQFAVGGPLDLAERSAMAAGQYSGSFQRAKAMSEMANVKQDLFYAQELGEDLARYETASQRLIRAGKALGSELFDATEGGSNTLTKLATEVEELVNIVRWFQGKKKMEFESPDETLVPKNVEFFPGPFPHNPLPEKSKKGGGGGMPSFFDMILNPIGAAAGFWGGGG